MKKLSEMLQRYGHFKLAQEVLNLDPYSRYRVVVQYPEFDDEGLPYFSSSGIRETLSVSQRELDKLKQQAGGGQLKIISTDKRLSKPR
jgi:hypothetical protein